MKGWMFLVFCLQLFVAKGQTYDKAKVWEHATFLVQHKGHHLMRVELSSGQTSMGGVNWEGLFQSEVSKELVFDAVLVNSHLVRVYFSKYVPLDEIRRRAEPYYSADLHISQPVEIAIGSQEYKDVSGR